MLVFPRAGWLLTCLLSALASCAPPGYHYETGSFTPTPNQPLILVRPPEAPARPSAAVIFAARACAEVADKSALLDTCRGQAFQRYADCEIERSHAQVTMQTIQWGMRQSGGTAAQVVQSDLAGINGWSPASGPYWEPQRNPISRQDTAAILRWAVRDASTTTPKEFGARIFRRCLGG